MNRNTSLSLRMATMLALGVSATAAQALTLDINGVQHRMHPGSGDISEFTQVTPVNIVASSFNPTTEIWNAGVIGTFGAGSRRRTNGVFFFKLPSVASSANILSAGATLDLLSKADSPSFRVDAWGLGFVSTATINTDWRLFADSDASPGLGIPARVKIQDNLISPASPVGTTITTSGSGSATLVNFLQSLYDAGAVPGDFAVIRLSPDVNLIPHQGGTPFYDIRLVHPEPPLPECGGLTATIVGTLGDDVLIGTASDDIIFGDEGADILFGKAGNDIICGGDGADLIIGGQGDDLLRGDAGKDFIRGGAGTDTVIGGGGADFLSGGPGFDTLKGKAGDDRMTGGDGDDDMDGGNGDDMLLGGPGNDTLTGNDDNDLCDNSSGTDTLNGCEIMTQ